MSEEVFVTGEGYVDNAWWCKINYNDSEAYVMKVYISTTKPVENVEPEAWDGSYEEAIKDYPKDITKSTKYDYSSIKNYSINIPSKEGTNDYYLGEGFIEEEHTISEGCLAYYNNYSISYSFM